MATRDGTATAMQQNRLRRLETFLDVAYAVLFVTFIMYLPQTEDMAWMDLEFGLMSLLWDHSTDLMRLVIAMSLVLINWNLTQKLLGPLERSDGVHVLLALLKLVFVCLFLFFAIADPMLESVSSLVGQSISLAIAGFIGSAGWWYARRHGLVREGLTEADRDDIGKRVVIEPTTALLTTGLAIIGPFVWSLGWVVIPAVLVGARRLLERDREGRGAR